VRAYVGGTHEDLVGVWNGVMEQESGWCADLVGVCNGVMEQESGWCAGLFVVWVLYGVRIWVANDCLVSAYVCVD